MAAIDYQRHRAALRALLSDEPQAPIAALAPGYEGPALWIGPAAGELRMNPAAGVLCEPNGDVQAQVASFASAVAAAQAPRMTTIVVEPVAERSRRFALTGLPQDGGVLVLARETTAETDNIRTLKASREMFRDVALCAGGLGFETDEKGLFRWVGPGKALGFAPETMIGHAASGFLLPQSPDAFDPFAAQEAFDDAPVWAQSLDQGPRALRVSVRPVFDGAGAWRGVRGHARDETMDLRHIRRDRFLQSALEALRTADSPSALIQSLAVAAGEACDAQTVWIFCTPPGPETVCSTGTAPCDLLRAIAGRTIADGVQFPALFTAGDWTGLALSLKSQNETQGAILLALPATSGEVTRDVQEMLRLIAPMASVALAQARLTATANAQAARDALTGLLNQASWREALDARLRDGAAGAVLAVECDRFKAFGDGLGRAASEELLVEIAARLRLVAGSQGICARLDEACFALWCEAADEAAAQTMTDAVVEAFRIASRRMSLALAATPISGLAFAKDANSAETLTQNALQALAQAKRQGRGRGTPPPCSKT